MFTGNCTIHIQLEPEPNVDVEALQQQTSVILDDICQLDGVQARIARGNQPEKDERGDPITVGAIVISMITGGVVTTLIQFLRDWALRGENRKVIIKAEVDGNKIELEYFPSGTKETELSAFAKVLTEMLEDRKKSHSTKK